MPFYRLTSTAEPRIIVEQIAPHNFILRRGFRYKAPFRKEPFVVPACEETDLASVPWPFWWLIASYGRHTKAAVAHDALIDPSDRIRDIDRVPRREVDRLFFYALKESGFGEPRERRRTSWLRRWVMYAAVAIPGTMKKEAPVRFGLVIAHLVGFVALVACFVMSRWVDAAWPPPYLDFALPVFDVHPFDGCLGLAAVGLVGFLWAFEPHVDTKLGFGLWPAAIFATVVAVPFTILLAIPWLIFALGDALYNVALSIKRGEWQGGPIVTPTRNAGEL